MVSNRHVSALMVFGLVLFSHSRATASTVLAMSLEQMTERAQMIFTGRVVGTRADWNAERTRIYTYVTLEVDRFLKGDATSNTVTIRMWGGRVGRYRSFVPGTPQFATGENVLLFCSGAQARVPTVLGLSLGKFSVTADGSGEAMLKRDISGLMIANHRSDSRQVGDPVTRFRLSEVESRIAEALR